MIHSVKEQITADFEKAKSAGGVRVGRIRQILQDALTQTVTELKQGTGEMGSIAKETTVTLRENFKDGQKPAQQNEVVPMQVEIQDETDVTVVAVELTVERPAEPLYSELAGSELVDTINAECFETVPPQVVEPVSEPAEPTTTESFVDSLKALLEQRMHSFKDGETYAMLQEQLTKLKTLMATVDVKLANRYGNRYEGLKQEFSQDMAKAKIWYENMKASDNARGISLVEHKQAELVSKTGETGVTIAQKEEKIKQLLKERWQTATKFQK